MSAFVTILSGHTSPETAYLVNDYPYGFTLRCKIRYWLETNKKHGMRFMSQTTNPKKAGEVWNKPKASTYAPLAVMGLDEKGHVKWTGLRAWATDEVIDAFATDYAVALTSDFAVGTLKYLKTLNKLNAIRKAALAAEVPA